MSYLPENGVANSLMPVTMSSLAWHQSNMVNANTHNFELTGGRQPIQQSQTQHMANANSAGLMVCSPNQLLYNPTSFYPPPATPSLATPFLDSHSNQHQNDPTRFWNSFGGPSTTQPILRGRDLVGHPEHHKFFGSTVTHSYFPMPSTGLNPPPRSLMQAPPPLDYHGIPYNQHNNSNATVLSHYPLSATSTYPVVTSNTLPFPASTDQKAMLCTLTSPKPAPSTNQLINSRYSIFNTNHNLNQRINNIQQNPAVSVNDISLMNPSSISQEPMLNQRMRGRGRAQYRNGLIPTLQCPMCQKRYCRKSTLRSHIKQHSGQRPHACQYCEKTFSQAANLTAHQRIHTGEKPYSCNICGRPFSQSSSLATHRRTHTGEKPYPCDHCAKRFADSSTLAKHVRTHTGSKPYQCTVCAQRFSQSGNLHRHVKTHKEQLNMTSC